MSQFRNLMMTKQGGGILPAGYQQVEYLESTRVQWIDTRVIDDGNTDIEIVCSYVSFDGTYPALLGARINADQILGLMASSTNSLYYSLNGTISVEDIFVEHIYAFDSTNRRWSVDGGQPQGVYSTTKTDLPIFLFGLNWSNKRLSATRIYSFKATKENAIIADFIPCYRKADNKPGMYDLVSGEFFINQGTGADFIIGPEI